MSSRSYRAGFFFVVLLLAGVSGYTLWSELRTNETIDTMVSASLERERLIGLMRLDAALLTEAVDDHINAQTDFEKQAADQAMAVNLKEIQEASDRYGKNLPKGEAELWDRFGDVSERMVKKVEKTVRYSTRKEAERAREHMEAEVRPIGFELDEVGNALAKKNAEETQALLRQLERLRLRTTMVGSAVVVLAVLLSLVVAFQVSRLLEQKERVIQAQLSELDRRNQELDGFAARVAHDLVAPLSPLKGYLTLARRGAGDPMVKELLGQAEASTSRMTELVEALLRFCRAGTPSEKSDGELDVAVATVLLEASQAAQAAGVPLDRELAEHVRATCPASLLQSIARNLVSNAVKYSALKPGARVSVRVSKSQGKAVLEVRDSGPGISTEARPQLFTPFFRAAETRQVPGHGLGLATTKRLVDAHGGTLELASLPGLGTTVTVSLPLVESVRNAEPTRAAPERATS